MSENGRGWGRDGFDREERGRDEEERPRRLSPGKVASSYLIGDSAVRRLSVSPGKRTLTMQIPARDPVQAKAVSSEGASAAAAFQIPARLSAPRLDSILPWPDPHPVGEIPPAVQRQAEGAAERGGDDGAIRERAARGVGGAGQPLPFLERIQAAFGHHDVSGIEAHVGGPAAAAAAEIGAEAYATGHHVAFARSPELHTAAHEAAHVIQQRGGVQLEGGVGRVGDVYERNADQVADRVVQGESAEGLLDELAGGSHRGAVQMRKEGRATGSDEVAPDEQALANPPPVAMSVQFSGLVFTPAPGTRWIAGLDKVLVANAIAVKALVGDAYSPGLARQTDRFVRSQEGFDGTLSGRAVRDEAMDEFRIGASLALDFIQFLRDAKKLPLTLTQERIDKLQLGKDVSDAWHFIKAVEPPLPAWYSEGLFWDQVLAEEHEPLLLDFRARMSAHDASKKPATREALETSLHALVAPLRPDMELVERVRADASLTDHPSYRELWQLPTVDPARPMIPPAGVDARVNEEAASRLLQQARTNRAAGGQARDGGPAGSKARRALLDGMGIAADALADNEKDGGPREDGGLRPAANRANAPPVPSTMSAYPALPPPFTRPAGAAHTFLMSLQYPTDTLEALGATFENRYTWQLIRVPDGDLARLGDVAKDQKAKGHRPSFVDVAGHAAARQRDYLGEDVKRVQGALEGLEVELGPMYAGALQLAAASRAVGVVGQVVKTFIQAAFEPDSQQTVLFEKPGLYVVRCRVDRPAGDDAQFVRAPSVAWHPVFVRPPQAVAELALEGQLRARVHSDERLREIEAELASDALDAETRAQLEEEGATLRIALYGSVEGVLATEKQTLEKRRRELQNRREPAAGRAEPGQERAIELEQIERRLDEIAEILETRRERHEEHVVAGREGPIRIPATFVSDEGKTLSLILEAMEQPTRGGSVVYHVTDATTKDSSQATGAPKANRTDAIADAVQQLLEKASGYGRGYVSIHVPARDGAIARAASDADPAPPMRTLRIEADLAAIAMEGIDNIATAISVAAVAAAPLTGGASLMFLLPVGAIGAIPSTYRLLDRAAAGTLRLDLASAMDIVNIVGSAAGMGQMAAAGLKSIQVGSGLMMIGLGSDGLGVALAGAQLIEAARDIDPNAPPGVRQAMLMELIARQLLDAGLQVGSGLARRAQELKARHTAAGADAGLDRAADALHQRFQAAAGGETPIFEDPSVTPNTAQVRFDLDGYGLVANVRVAMSPGASPDSVLPHASAVQALRRFEPVQSLLRNLLDRVAVLAAGSEGGDTMTGRVGRELRDLPARLRELQRKVADGALSAGDVESAIRDLLRRMQGFEAELDAASAGGRDPRDPAAGGSPGHASRPGPRPDAEHHARGEEAGDRGGTPRPRGAEDEADSIIRDASPQDRKLLESVLALDPREARRVIREYGEEIVDYLRSNPLTSVHDLEKALKRLRAEVKHRVEGLVDGIDVSRPPDGWQFMDRNRGVITESDGTRVLETDVYGPNGAQGYFVRAYNPIDKVLELRMAFLKLGGEEKALPNIVGKQSGAAEMVRGRGTPTVQYVTLYQMKKLGVPMGRSGQSNPGVKSVHMSDIQNIETIVHLHWLREHVGGDTSELVRHTASVKYAETTATQSGYRRSDRPVVTGEHEWPIRRLLDFQERGDPQRIAENNAILAKYRSKSGQPYSRDTPMLMAFDIDFSVSVEQ